MTLEETVCNHRRTSSSVTNQTCNNNKKIPFKHIPRGSSKIDSENVLSKHDIILKPFCEEATLPRTLGVFSAGMLNMGSNIGCGIFLIQGIMLKDVGSPGAVILLFILAAIVSTLGTWAFTELGCMIPISGGPKEYLNAAFQRPRGMLGFVFSHVWIWVMMPGQAASTAMEAGMYFMHILYGSHKEVRQIGGDSHFSSNYEHYVQYSAAAMIILMTVIHAMTPRFGIMIMDYLTGLKIGVLLLVLVIGFPALIGVQAGIPILTWKSLFNGTKYDANTMINSFFQVLYIYDGWMTANFSLSEIKYPVRNLPRAAFGATFATTILYVGATISFFLVVPVSMINSDNSVIGIQFFEATLGKTFGGKVIPIFICLAGFSNSMTICYANSRLIFEAAKDHMLPPQKIWSQISHYKSPLASLVLNCFVCIVFILAPPPGKSYEFLITLASYPEWIFLGLTVIGLHRLRRLRPDVHRPIKSPWLGNMIFIFVCFLLMVIPFFPPSIDSERLGPYYLPPLIAWIVIALITMIWYIYSEIFHQMDGCSKEDIFEYARRVIEADMHEEILDSYI
jgi:amino acid transporter